MLTAGTTSIKESIIVFSVLVCIRVECIRQECSVTKKFRALGKKDKEIYLC